MTSGKGAADRSGWDTARIRRALRSVIEPVSGRNIVDEGCVSDVHMHDAGSACIELAPDKVRPADKETIRASAVMAAQGVGGIEQVEVRYAGEQAGPTLKLDKSMPSGRPPEAPAAAPPRAVRPAGARTILAVSSAKGGVGKSTVTLNLAKALAKRGRRTGLLDADIYGPSVPTMTGRTGTMADVGASELIVPVEFEGVRTMSMGFIVPEGKAVAWRGPMVMNALIQMLSGVDWGELDYLLIDMPPGTGDVALTLVQQASIDGAIIVSTPQEVALADVRRGVQFFEKTHVPIVGVIENMSFLRDPATGADVDLFGRGGARAEAEKLGARFLGEVPFDISLRKSADTGEAAGAPISKVFQVLAESVEEAVAEAVRPA